MIRPDSPALGRFVSDATRAACLESIARRQSSRSRLDLLRLELAEQCVDRDLSGDAHRELERLLEDGTADEIDDVLSHLRRMPKIRSGMFDVDAAVSARFEELADERDDRERVHLEQVARVAWRAGADVAAHRVTLDDAARRIDAIVSVEDPDSPVARALVPFARARDVADRAFADGMRARGAVR